MIRKMKIFFASFFVLALLGNMVAYASETKTTNDLTSPVDLDRQTFTTIEDSILVPANDTEFHVYAFDMQGTVIGDGVRLRSAASNTSSVLELMYSGERVWIDSSYSNANWYRVIRQSTGRTGYVNWEYIQPDYAR